MTHLTMLDNVKNSPTEGMEVSSPVTIVETPPVVVMGIRAYRKDHSWTENHDRHYGK